MTVHLILAIIVFCLFMYMLLKFATKNHDVFKKQGIKYLKPWPFLGNNDMMFRGQGVVDMVLCAYNKYPKEEVVGIFDFSNPIYVLRNLDLIKQITVKDFAHFQDHHFVINSEVDELFGNVLFAMHGKQWRDMRCSLSPIFTGSKMRIMLKFIAKCANDFTNYICEKHEKNGLTAYDIKNIFCRYTTDAIATCAFGVECNSLKNPTNEIYTLGQELLVFNQPVKTSIKFLIMRVFPKLAKFLGVKLIVDKSRKKFQHVILDTVNVRKQEKIFRPDVLQTLMDLTENPIKEDADDNDNDIDYIDDNSKPNGEIKRTWTDKEILAQSFLFFVGGLDAGSRVTSFIAYELACHPEIQEKLCEEIDKTHESLNGNPLTYEALNRNKYLEMVILENLRKWSPAAMADRKCMDTYKYENENGFKITFEKGNIVWIPIHALHMDPNYFPNPDKFIPERFSEENKSKIVPYSFLPFGVGPRNCIGLRFAMMQIKTLLYYLLLKCKFGVCTETDIPMKFTSSAFGLTPKNPIKLYIEPRKQKS